MLKLIIFYIKVKQNRNKNDNEGNSKLTMSSKYRILNVDFYM